MSLADLSLEVLYDTHRDLDNQIQALRERKLAVMREIESRFPEPEAESQVVSPGFIESESVVPSLDAAASPPRRRRWWQT